MTPFTFEELNKLALGVEDDASLPYFVPHFGGCVSPPDKYSWCVTRINLVYNARTHFRAMLDVALEYSLYKRALLDLLPNFATKEIRVTGGGEKSSTWNQIKVDRLQIPVFRVARTGGTLIGSGLPAGFGVGLLKNLPAVARTGCTSVRLTRRDHFKSKFAKDSKVCSPLSTLGVDRNALFMSSADKLAHTFLEITPLVMKKDLLLAIDVGTGSVRAALVTSSGKTLAFAAKEHEQIVPRFGWSQQSPQTWWEGAIFSIRSVIAQVDSAAERIDGIAACGQNHGTVLINNAGELVLKEVPLWNDKRTRQIVDTFLREQDTDALLPIAANPPTVAWPGFKLVWIMQNEPKAYEAAQTVLMPKDYINFKLTGERTIDFTEASCSYLFDVRTKNWSTNILDLLGLDPRKLPRLSSPCEILGVITDEAARATDLLAGTPVTVSAGDFPVSLLGAGVTRPGMGCDLTGTSTLIALLAEEAVLDPLITNIQGIIGGWAAFTIVDAGGDAMRWARRAFHEKAYSYEKIIRLAGSVPPGSDKLLFLPYLNGERLARKANSRAQFFGLTSGHGAGHLHRAVMEGVAFASRRTLNS